jgi:hypothetical protein
VSVRKRLFSKVVTSLSEQIKAEGFEVPRSRLGAEAWSLERPGVAALMEKIRQAGTVLKEFAGTTPYRGVLTGFNEAFLLDTQTKTRLVEADPHGESEGQTRLCSMIRTCSNPDS